MTPAEQKATTSPGSCPACGPCGSPWRNRNGSLAQGRHPGQAPALSDSRIHRWQRPGTTPRRRLVPPMSSPAESNGGGTGGGGSRLHRILMCPVIALLYTQPERLLTKEVAMAKAWLCRIGKHRWQRLSNPQGGLVQRMLADAKSNASSSVRRSPPCQGDKLGLVGEVAGEADGCLGHGPPVAWPGGLPCPWNRGTVYTVACQQSTRGKRQSQRSRPWNQARRAGPGSAGPGWLAALGGWGLGMPSYRPAMDPSHSGVVGERGFPAYEVAACRPLSQATRNQSLAPPYS